MKREIYKVFATQIVISESNPQGVLSDISGYPKAFDSRTYKATAENPNGDRDIALLAAQADFKAEALALSTADSPNRVGWCVYIIRASDGERIDRKAWGGFPDMTPPEPEPEPEEEL
jgi:hypothetical protein